MLTTPGPYATGTMRPSSIESCRGEPVFWRRSGSSRVGGRPRAPRTRWAGPDVTLQGAPSPDGRWISYASAADGALALRSTAGGEIRKIARPPVRSHEFAYFSVFSRDGDKVAYAWFNEQGFYELRVTRVSPEDGAPLTLYRNEVAGFVQPCAWTPDNRYVLTLLFRRDNISQIALIPAAGGPPRVLRSLNWVYPKRMDVSPDGHWIVYDNFAAEGKPERTIFLLAADGSKEIRLVDAPGNYLSPMWSPTGAASCSPARPTVKWNSGRWMSRGHCARGAVPHLRHAGPYPAVGYREFRRSLLRGAHRRAGYFDCG